MTPSSSPVHEIDFEIVSAILDLTDRCPHCGGERTYRRVHLRPTPLNMSDFRNHTLVELLNEVFTYYNRNWEAGGGTQKYYCIAKRLFVRRVKRAGRSARLAYNYIRYIE